jgi:hypothetical protein
VANFIVVDACIPHTQLPTEIKQSREETIRQSWIGVMEARLVREELAKCWRTGD